MSDKDIEERQEKLKFFKYRRKIKNKEYRYYNFYRKNLPTRAIIPLKEFVEETFAGIKLKFDVDKSKILEKPFILEIEKPINIDDESYNYKIILKQHYSILDIYLYYKDPDSDTWYEFAAVRHVMVIPRWEDWEEWEKAKKLILREIVLQLYKIYIKSGHLV